MDEVIIVENVWKTYRTRRREIQVLRGVSLSIKNKSLACILGPNGAGKTTLLKIIAGFIKPDKGKVIILNKSSQDRDVKTRIGFMPQEDILFDSLNIIEHLELLENLRNVRVDKEFVFNLLENLGLKEVISLNIGRLSGGQRRLVQLLLAISHKPKIIILDEPIAFVDKENRDIILNVIYKLVSMEGATVVIASHDTYACSKADKVFELRDGLIKEVRV